MLFHKKNEEKTTPTILGAGSRFVGNLTAKNTLQIHGLFDGDIIADTVIVGVNGMINGTLKAKQLFLHGTITGPVIANEASIFPTAQINGELQYAKLNIINNDKLECKLKKIAPVGKATTKIKGV